MRHLKAGKRLGVTTSHRKALMRNLVTALLEHGEIRTTLTKAKEMRKYFDKMISLGKRNNLHARRQAASFIKSKDVVKKLFEEYGPLYGTRNGGYTRIYRLGTRLGDNSQMALIQMVGLDDSVEPVKEAVTETIEEVKEELQSEDQSVEEEADATAAAATEAVDEVEAKEEEPQAAVDTTQGEAEDDSTESAEPESPETVAEEPEEASGDDADQAEKSEDTDDKEEK